MGQLDRCAIKLSQNTDVRYLTRRCAWSLSQSTRLAEAIPTESSIGVRRTEDPKPSIFGATARGKKKFTLVVVATLRMAFWCAGGSSADDLGTVPIFKRVTTCGTKYTEFSPGAARAGAHHTPPYRLFRTRGPPAVSGLVRSPASHFDADDSRACSTPLGHTLGRLAAASPPTPRTDPTPSQARSSFEGWTTWGDGCSGSSARPETLIENAFVG
ncbi:hypothetical protein EVAR_94941_1 [Eumeta japonica]|uniref:Uncharacterized protein n=1 Tax=Eumeta variegata TaxID=151549 RepID=A0A4C1SUS5_EUMVA|nr:hypothetical protein EVAR_94941_1 [Eumeta japonica]